MKNVLVVFGTRPEAIKMAPVVRALTARPDLYAVSVCVTAQHRGLLDQVLKFFDLTPDYDLNIMAPGQDLYDVTGKALYGMREVLKQSAPDLVLVHGDTTTAFTAALAAFYARIPVGHVEAGLRTYDMDSPFPEEFNRQAIGRMADLHFAPTRQARGNLLKEGVSGEKIFVTGNTSIDALLWAKGQVLESAAPAGKTILITAHRRENFGEGIANICAAVKELAEKYPDMGFVYPVHPNPNVAGPVQAALGGLPNVRLEAPYDYPDFVRAMNDAYLILTDSGGVQEEAPSLGKPVLVLRDTTERPEAVAAGTARLIGANAAAITRAVVNLIEDKAAYDAMATAANPYGEGRAAHHIEHAVQQWAYPEVHPGLSATLSPVARVTPPADVPRGLRAVNG